MTENQPSVQTKNPSPSASHCADTQLLTSPHLCSNCRKCAQKPLPTEDFSDGIPVDFPVLKRAACICALICVRVRECPLNVCAPVHVCVQSSHTQVLAISHAGRFSAECTFPLQSIVCLLKKSYQ